MCSPLRVWRRCRHCTAESDRVACRERRPDSRQEAIYRSGRFVEAFPVKHVTAVDSLGAQLVAEKIGKGLFHRRLYDAGLLGHDEQSRARMGDGGQLRAEFTPACDHRRPMEPESKPAILPFNEVLGHIFDDGGVDGIAEAVVAANGGLLHRSVTSVRYRFRGPLVGGVGRKRERWVEHDEACDPVGMHGDESEADHTAVGVPDHINRGQIVGVERVDEIGDVLADVPRPVAERPSVAPQIDRDGLSLRPPLLGEPTEAPPVGGDPVDGEDGRTRWRAELVNMEKCHTGTVVRDQSR